MDTVWPRTENPFGCRKLRDVPAIPHCNQLLKAKNTIPNAQTCIVPKDYAITKFISAALDNFLLNESILEVLDTITLKPLNNKFFENKPDLAKSIFSIPYPEVATYMLGYPSTMGN